MGRCAQNALPYFCKLPPGDQTIFPRRWPSADAAAPARRRGEYGPGYRFVGPMNGTKVQVVVQTGEELDYPDGIAATLKPRTITHGSALVR